MNKFIFFFFVLCVPSVIAVDCNYFTHKDYCVQIQNSNISNSEKEYLLGNIMSDNHNTPDHALVNAWNKNIPTDIKPEGVLTADKGVIRNAWVKMLAVTPSVLLNGTLLIDTNGKVLTGFKHEVVIPTSVDSGDCKTYRMLQSNTEVLRVYANNMLQGNGHSVSYTASGNVTFKAVYDIAVTTKVDHYKWYDNYYYKTCKYHHTTYTTETLSLTDFITGKVDDTLLEANFVITNQYLNTTKATFYFSDAVNTHLSFKDATFQQHNYAFSTIMTLAPLNVLVMKAEPLQTQEQQNLIYNENEVVVADTKGCQITQSNFFHDKIIYCNLNFTQEEIIVTTDKTVYNEDEIIHVQISPKGQYTVLYGTSNETTTGNIDLIATYPYNRINVKSSTVEKVVYVHVKDEKPLNVVFSVMVFGTVNTAFIGLIRKYWGFTHG